MSQAPRNPFETGDQLGKPAEKSGNTWLWVLAIVGGIFLFGAIICCGVGFYAWNQTTGLIADAVIEEYADDPVVMEQIGTISSTEMDVSEAITESSKDEDITAMVFNVQGDKGSGRIIHRTNQRTGDVKTVLVMDSGESFELEAPDDYADLGDELEDLESVDDVSETIDQPDAGETVNEEIVTTPAAD